MLMAGPLVSLAAMTTPALYAQAAPTQDGPNPTGGPDIVRVHLIGNNDIIRMKNAGLADDVLLQTIQLQPGRYDTAPNDLIALKQAGVSDRVISAMQAHGTGLTQRESPGGATPTLLRVPHRPIDPPPLAPGIDEIGVYYKDANGGWQLLETERVQYRSSNRLKTALTDGILREDMNGWLDTPQSPLVLKTGVELLIYAPFGTQGDEYDFLRLNEHKNARDFRVRTGGVFHSETGAGRNELEFKTKKISSQMYTFTVPKDIEKGEYGVLPPGSANQRGMGYVGKIFTFSIRE